MFKPTYLYIKTHNKTGLKYFGKTIEADPHKYRGSGTRWMNHIRYHGYDVTTEILGYYLDEADCVKTAVTFTEQNNIVESKDWANLKPETGIDGGWSETARKEARKKINTPAAIEKMLATQIQTQGEIMKAARDAARQPEVLNRMIETRIKNHGSPCAGFHTKEAKEKVAAANRKRQLGKPSIVKGRIGISKDGVKKLVLATELETYEKQGWIKGYKNLPV